MNMTQKVLTQIFESLLNTAAQAPTDDIVNRDGISLMKQGFELIMQAHREGGATGPTSPLLAEARQLLADIEQFKPFRSIEDSPKERIEEFFVVDEDIPITLSTIAKQLSSISAQIDTLPSRLAPWVHLRHVDVSQIVQWDGSFTKDEDIALAVRNALTGLPISTARNPIVLELTKMAR